MHTRVPIVLPNPQPNHIAGLHSQLNDMVISLTSISDEMRPMLQYSNDNAVTDTGSKSFMTNQSLQRGP